MWVLCLGEPCFQAVVSWCIVCQGPCRCQFDSRCLLPFVLLGKRCPSRPLNRFNSLVPSCGARHCQSGTSLSVGGNPCTTGMTRTSTLEVICQCLFVAQSCKCVSWAVGQGSSRSCLWTAKDFSFSRVFPCSIAPWSCYDDTAWSWGMLQCHLQKYP